MEYDVTEEEYNKALNKMSKLKREWFDAKFKNIDKKEKATEEIEVKKEIQKCLAIILSYENIKKMEERGRNK